MDLSINFECPECRKVQLLKIVDLAPGRNRSCRHCGTPTELTEAAVAELACRLRSFFNGEHPARQDNQAFGQKP